MADKNHTITAEELDDVSGGMIFNATGYEGLSTLPWEVLDNNNCKVLGAFSTKDEAIKYAQTFDDDTSYDTQEVTWDIVQRLRKNPNVPS